MITVGNCSNMGTNSRSEFERLRCIIQWSELWAKQICPVHQTLNVMQKSLKTLLVSMDRLVELSRVFWLEWCCGVIVLVGELFVIVQDSGLWLPAQLLLAPEYVYTQGASKWYVIFNCFPFWVSRELISLLNYQCEYGHWQDAYEGTQIL